MADVNEGPASASPMPLEAQASSRSSWASKEDWLAQKDNIQRLYADNTLADVIKIMEARHGFKATKKMYKDRIARWGLRKNHEEREMRAVVRKSQQRARRGFPSKFLIRGREATYDEASHYFARKKMTIEEIINRAYSVTPEAVKCFTPLASPLATPAVLAAPEQIFINLRTYICGSFEAGRWVITDPGTYCYTTGSYVHKINNLTVACERACNLNNKGRFEEATNDLSSVMAEIPDLLQNGSPTFLSRIVFLMLDLRWRKRPEIAMLFLRTFAGFSQIIFGETHPLRLIFISLVSTECRLFESLNEEILRKLADDLENVLGPLHLNTLEGRSCTATAILFRDGERAEQQLQTLLQMCEGSLGKVAYRTWIVRLNLAHLQRINGKVQESARQCNSLLNFVESKGQPNTNIYIQADALSILARCYYGMQESVMAEATIRKAIYLRTKIWGEDDAVARVWSLALETWLVKWGRLDDAEAIRSRTQRRLHPLEGNI